MVVKINHFHNKIIYGASPVVHRKAGRQKTPLKAKKCAHVSAFKSLDKKAKAYIMLNRVLRYNGRRFASFPIGLMAEGGMLMVTYTELFAFCMLIIALIGLVKSHYDKK